MTEPNFSIDFTARMLATTACNVGDLLVFDAAAVLNDTLGYWSVSSTANRATANARTQAVALTEYGGSAVGKVSYQASGTVSQRISGLPDGYPTLALVRASSTGRFERISGYTPGDDVVGYAEPDGRVHLHLGIPWQLIVGLASTGPTITEARTGQIDDIPSDLVGTPADVIHFSGSNPNVTGIAGGTESRRIFLSQQTDTALVLKSSNAGSVAENQLILPKATLTLDHTRGVWMVYDNVRERWVFDGFAPPAGNEGDMVGLDANGNLTTLGAPSGALPWFDPKDYGALYDGTTDDLAAYDACLTAVPDNGGVIVLSGYSWLSDVWRVNKSVVIWGLAGGNRAVGHGYTVAPGSEAALSVGPVSPGGLLPGNALRHLVTNVTVRSRIMVHPTANGGTSGGASIASCLRPWGDSEIVRKRELFVAHSNASPTRCFRCTDTGNGDASGLFGAVEPTWNTTIGGTTTTDGMTFVTEAVISPDTHQTGHAYIVGDRVFALNDNRFYFQCTVAGTTSGSRPAILAGGDKAPIGISIQDTVTDGGVTWSVRMADGIYVSAPEGTVQFCEAYGFTNVAFRHQGGAGQDVRVTATNVDNFRNLSCYAELCGAGWYAQGDDANGYTVDRPVANFIGWVHPKPYNLSLSDLGTGGHIVHDHSQVGGMIANLYCQDSTGRPILKSSDTSVLTVLSCTSEIFLDCHFRATGGQTTIIGGRLGITSDSVGVLCLDQNGLGRGITEKDTHGGVPLVITLLGQDGTSAYALRALDTNDSNGVNDLRMRYGTIAPNSRDGHWAMCHGLQSANTAYLLSTAKCGVAAPGVGWLTFPFGHLVGNPEAGAVFRGSEDAWEYTYLRGGDRIAGDEFVDGDSTRIVTADGAKGVPWTAQFSINLECHETYVPWAIPATMVEPTTNTDDPAGGEKVFRCTTEGLKGALEPNWATATMIGDTVTDNAATWTLYDFTPPYRLESSTDPAPGVDTQVMFNNASAEDTTDQITIVAGRVNIVSPITTGTPVYRVANLDIVSYVTKAATVATTQVNCGTVTLADQTTAAIDVIVRCSRDTSNTKRGVWKFSAVVSRNGAGAVLDVLNVGDAFNLTGGTVTCDVSGNDFRVRITPADTDARKWDSEIRAQVNT